MGRIKVLSCPLLLGESDRFILYLTVECPMKPLCDTQGLEKHVLSVLQGGPVNPRAVAAIYGGMTLFYKSSRGPVPISRAQISHKLCVSSGEDIPILSRDDDMLELLANVFYKGSLPGVVGASAEGALLVVRPCSNGPCQPSPTGVSYG